jgi:hypothetical protein
MLILSASDCLSLTITAIFFIDTLNDNGNAGKKTIKKPYQSIKGVYGQPMELLICMGGKRLSLPAVFKQLQNAFYGVAFRVR